MPPKIKITKTDIIQTALSLVREAGAEALNARSIASALNCSTQPIFSNFESMEDLENSVTVAAYERYLGFISTEVESGKYPAYKAFGMAYIRFAKEEKELFKLLFMRDRGEKDLLPTVDFDSSVEMIMKNNGFSREQAQLMHLEMWVCVHGIATILVTSFLTLEWDLISNMLTDTYQGLRIKHSLEENETK
jgi:AcrR family transcriptional regulator